MAFAAQWRVGLAIAGAAGFAITSHELMLHAAARPWAAALLLGPPLAAGFAFALKNRHAGVAALVAAGAAGAAAITLRGAAGDVNRLYVAQHVVLHLALFAAFAGSLRGGGLSMIGAMAARLHPLTPAMRGYTRRVTQLWAGYFAGMAALSLAVYAAAPWPWWSLLANVGTPLAIAGLFLGEYALRYRLHPEFERSRLIDMLQAFGRRHRGSGDERQAAP